MKIADMLPPVPDDKWKLARQSGVKYAVTRLHPELTGAPAPDTFEVMLRSKTQFENAGLKLVGLEGDQFPMHRIKEGLPDRDEDIEKFQAIIRNAGALGLEFFCYNFMAKFKAYRTSVTTRARGGALTSAFSQAQIEGAPIIPDAPVDHQAMWSNYEYFLRAVVPVAEEAGVRLALHPDDPPIPILRGVPRLFGTADAFRRALAIVPSHYNAITFCQGNFALFDESVESMIEEFKSSVAFVHFRDVRGAKYDFVETFHDDGPTDMAKMLRLYDDAGFAGYLRPDHVPAMGSEIDGHGLSTHQSAGYEALGRLYAIGYIRGLLNGAGIVEN